MKRIFTLLFLLGSMNSFSQVIAKWSFETFGFNTAASQAPVLSTGTAVADSGLQVTGSLFTGYHASTATIWSTPSGNGTANAASSNNWALGDYYQFNASTTGYNGIAIKFDQTSSSTGPVEFKVQYSTNGTSYSDFATYSVPTAAGVVIGWSGTTFKPESSLTFDLSSISSLNNQPMVYIRLAMAGPNNAGGTAVATGGTNRVDNFAFVTASSLPLHLTSFKGALNNGKASLVWTSQNETNVAGFSIEKSLDGRNYSEIAFVKAYNGSTNTYNAEDVRVKAGTNFYRLKLVDKDGSFTYSSVVVLANRSIKAEVFPNPVTSTLTISHDRAEKGAVVRIMSMEGRQVKMMNIVAGAQQTSLPVSELVKGNYLLVFESNGENATTKFTKQ